MEETLHVTYEWKLDKPDPHLPHHLILLATANKKYPTHWLLGQLESQRENNEKQKILLTVGLLLCVCASVSDIWGGLCVEGIVSVYNAFLRNVFV